MLYINNSSFVVKIDFITSSSITTGVKQTKIKLELALNKKKMLKITPYNLIDTKVETIKLVCKQNF